GAAEPPLGSTALGSGAAARPLGSAAAEPPLEVGPFYYGCAPDGDPVLPACDTPATREHWRSRGRIPSLAARGVSTRRPVRSTGRSDPAPHAALAGAGARPAPARDLLLPREHRRRRRRVQPSGQGAVLPDRAAFGRRERRPARFPVRRQRSGCGGSPGPPPTPRPHRRAADGHGQTAGSTTVQRRRSRRGAQ